MLLLWGENYSYRQSIPSPKYIRKWIIWANSKIWQTYFGRFPEILSWETMRTCLNGYWMGNRRPTNTHILRSALRNSQTKKMFSTIQSTGEMVFRIWGTKGRSRRAACVCALRMRDAFPGNNRDKSRCAEPRIPRTCLWGYWMGSDRRKHPRLMSHFFEQNILELCLLKISQIFSGFMQDSSCRWQWMAGETKLWAAKYSDKRPGHDGNILTKGRGRMEIFWCERERLSMIYAKCGRICSAVHEEWEQWGSSSRDSAKEILTFSERKFELTARIARTTRQGWRPSPWRWSGTSLSPRRSSPGRRLSRSSPSRSGPSLSSLERGGSRWFWSFGCVLFSKCKQRHDWANFGCVTYPPPEPGSRSTREPYKYEYRFKYLWIQLKLQIRWYLCHLPSTWNRVRLHNTMIKMEMHLQVLIQTQI